MTEVLITPFARTVDLKMSTVPRAQLNIGPKGEGNDENTGH